MIVKYSHIRSPINKTASLQRCTFWWDWFLSKILNNCGILLFIIIIRFGSLAKCASILRCFCRWRVPDAGRDRCGPRERGLFWHDCGWSCSECRTGRWGSCGNVRIPWSCTSCSPGCSSTIRGSHVRTCICFDRDTFLTPWSCGRAMIFVWGLRDWRRVGPWGRRRWNCCHCWRFVRGFSCLCATFAWGFTTLIV